MWGGRLNRTIPPYAPYRLRAPLDGGPGIEDRRVTLHDPYRTIDRANPDRGADVLVEIMEGLYPHHSHVN